MGDIFDGIDISELAGSEEPVFNSGTNAAAAGMKQGEGEQSAEKAEQTPSGNEKTEEPNEDPNAVDITNLAGTEDSAEEEEENIEGTTSSKTPADNKGSQSPSSQNTDATTSLASALAEAGVFSSLSEEEIGEITDVTTLLDAVKKQTTENRYADLNDDQKKYLDALKEGVPEKEFHQHTANAAQYKKVSNEQIEGNTAMITELVKRSLMVRGVDAETATEMAAIQAAKKDAATRGQAARDQLVAHEEKQLEDKLNNQKTEREAAETAEKEALVELKTKIQTMSEILPGVKANTQTKNKIFDSMTTPVGEDDNGNPLNELMQKYQEDPEFRYKLHAMYYQTKGLTDFKKFKATAKSSAIEELEQKLKGGQGTKTGTPDRSGGGGGRQSIAFPDSWA